MKKAIAAIVIVIGLFGVFELFTFSTDSDKSPFYMMFRDFKISPDINFCGEPVPFQSDDIRERYDRELLKTAYWQSETIMYFKRAKRWFPLIEKILREQGLPEDLKYVSVIESGLTNVVSPVGATGFWQLMPNTAKEFDMEIREEVDDRYDVEKSTYAACKYFKAAYKRFKNWTAVAASYNMGMGGLNSRMREQQVRNYYDLLLNTETSRYVFRILAYKAIFSNPKYYGYDPDEIDAYSPYDSYEVKIDSTIPNLMEYAIKMNSNYKIVKLMNPWLRENRLTVKTGKFYTIRFPKSGIYQYSELIPTKEDSNASVGDTILPDISDPGTATDPK